MAFEVRVTTDYLYVYCGDKNNAPELGELGTWVKGSSCYKLPNIHANRLKLQKWGMWLAPPPPQPIEPNWDLLPTGIKLLDFQKDACRFLLNSPLQGNLLALSPGLGKTLTSISSAILLGAKSVLVIAPLSLVYTWVSELEQWVGVVPQVTHGRKDVPLKTGWVVTNYDTVVNSPEKYSYPYDLVICDETILLKNRSAKRVKKLGEARRSWKRVWGLSGSPIANYIDDLYAQFHLLNPKQYTTYWGFVDRYCYRHATQWGTEITGTRLNIDYREEFADIMYSRSQEEVLDLPDLLYESIPVELPQVQKSLYRTMSEEMIAEWEGEVIQVFDVLPRLTRLQQVLSNPSNLGDGFPDVSGKRDTLLDLLSQNLIKLPLLLWVHWRPEIQKLRDVLGEKYRVGILEGKGENRQIVVDQFQNGMYDILIMPFTMGKFGFTLTHAQSAVYLDRTFDADAYTQSLARIHRYGLKHQAVVYHLWAPGTIDEALFKALMLKLKTITAISGSTAIRSNLVNLLKGKL